MTPALAVLTVSLVAWVLLLPVRAALDTSATWYLTLLDSILGTVFLAGLEGLFFSLLPLHFMDGAVVMRWSRLAWALLFGVVTFLWFQLLLNQDSEYAKAFSHTSVIVVVAALVFFILVTGTVWAYFRLREHPEKGVEEHASSEEA